MWHMKIVIIVIHFIVLTIFQFKKNIDHKIAREFRNAVSSEKEILSRVTKLKISRF